MQEPDPVQERDGGWELALPFQDWDYRILCPLLPGDTTIFGDVTKYATVGDRRIARISIADGGVEYDVPGAPHTAVAVHGYAAARPRAVTTWTPGTLRALDEGSRWSWEPSTGEWIVHVDVGVSGRTRVSMTVCDRGGKRPYMRKA